jgi:hypothetical protein
LHTSILLSSPKTRVHKVVTPVVVFGGSLVAFAWTQGDNIATEPFTTIFLLLTMWGCAAWVVWRPFRLRVADVVEEIDGALTIRRGQFVETVPYSDVEAIQVVRIGNVLGAKLILRKENRLGSEIGFHLNDPEPAAVAALDPVGHIERQIRASRERRAA